LRKNSSLGRNDFIPAFTALDFIEIHLQTGMVTWMNFAASQKRFSSWEKPGIGITLCYWLNAKFNKVR